MLSGPAFDDLERRAEYVMLTAEEMGRALYTPLLSFMPIIKYRSPVHLIDGINAVSTGDVIEHLWSRDIEAFFKKRSAQCETDSFAGV